jgi:NADP-dependent 3-hydroxy acid dehydrogenase YdfG
MARPVHPDRRPTVVTGASSGIGLATARLFAEAGYPVILGARRLETCATLAAEIRAAGGNAVAERLDLADAASIAAFARAAEDAFGPVEVVVSSAAQNVPGAALETAPEAFDELVQVNLGGAHRLVQAFGPGMQARRRGDLVFVSSDVVVRPRPQMAAYMASKWGLEGYIRALQMELEGSGVRAIVVRPGPTFTEMGMDWHPDTTAQVLAEWVRWGLARHGSFLKPDAIAAAVLNAVSAPRGVHLSVLELQPEAPITKESS